MYISTKRLLSGLVVAGFLLAGCSSSKEASSQASSSISTVVKENLVFGTPTSQALRVVFTNSTGLDIDSIKLVPIESDKNVTSPELMPSNSQWKNGDQADLYVQSGDKALGMSLEIQAKKDGETQTYTMPVFPTAALFEAATLARDSKASTSSSTSSASSASSSSQSTSRSSLSLQSILKLEDEELVMTWRQDGQTMSSQDYEAPEISDEGVVDEAEVTVEESVEEPTPPVTQPTTPVEETPSYSEPVVETPTVQEPAYTEDDYYYSDPVYIPPTTSTAPSSPVVDPTYGTPIVNPTEAPSTPTAPATSSGGAATSTPAVPDQGGENCVNPGDLILNTESSPIA